MPKADVIIIGGGPGGHEVAVAAAARGLKTVFFEKDRLGGTCLNRGCIPTKCLCASAEALSEARAAGYVTEVPQNAYSDAHARIDGVVDELREGMASISAGVTIVNAEAVLASGNRVLAEGTEYTADKIVIATGSHPAPLRCEGSEFALSSDDFLKLETLPQKLVVVGGGVIGLEFACIAAEFGSEVTVLEFCKEILPGQDSDVAKRLRSLLGRKGISIVTDACVTSISESGLVTYERRGKSCQIEADKVLAAVGRRPTLPKGCEETGISLTDKGFICIDENFMTSAPGIFAIGDVNGKCMLAHAASAQARKIMGEDVNLEVIPSVVFTRPECAFVSAPATAADTITTKVPYSASGKAMAIGATEGFVKLTREKDSGRLTACAAVGAQAGLLVAEAALAISAGLTADDILRTVHAHPTLSELLPLALT